MLTWAILAGSAALGGASSHSPTGAAARPFQASGNTHDDLGPLPQGSDMTDFQDGLRARAAQSDPTGRSGAGPRAVAYHPGGQPITTGPIAQHAPYPRLFRTGNIGLEPSIGLNRDGWVFAQAERPAAPALVGGVVLRSSDKGKTWQDVSPKTDSRYVHDVTLDPYLYLDPATGRVFTDDFVPPCQLLSWSDDGGVSWTTSLVSCNQTDHQTLFAGPPVISTTIGYPNIIYDCATAAGIAPPYSALVTCNKSVDGGRTFVPTGLPPYVDDPSQDGGDFGIAGHCDGATAHGSVGPDGTVYLPKGLCSQPWLAISHDEGATWTRVQVAGNGMGIDLTGIPDHEAGVAADADGNVYYTWMAHNRLPYLAVSRDGGGTWSKPIKIAPPGLKEADLPAIAIGARGKLAFAYMGSTNSPGSPFPGEGTCNPVQDPGGFLSCQDPPEYAAVTWNGYITMTANALASKPVLYTASVNDPTDPFETGTCGPDRCKAAYDFVDVEIGPEGTPWAVFVDACQGTSCSEVGEEVVGRLVGGPGLR